ncbi:MAG: hypothetical protein ACREJM_08485 [Candidatus Saccharimonadales bacterium]
MKIGPFGVKIVDSRKTPKALVPSGFLVQIVHAEVWCSVDLQSGAFNHSTTYPCVRTAAAEEVVKSSRCLLLNAPHARVESATE